MGVETKQRKNQMKTTFLKTATWLVISYILIAATAWYESGNLWVGLLAAFWASLIKTPVYSMHEALWSRFLKKQTIDFTICEYEEVVDAA